MNNTELRLEYCERSKGLDLPDEIEDVLEDDYVKNRELYTEETFSCIQALYAASDRTLSAETLLDIVRAYAAHDQGDGEMVV